MGRSVMTVSDAVMIVYLEHDAQDCDDWDWFLEDIRNVISQRYKSFVACDKWDGREQKRILENDLARVVVCEYCGLVSINLAIREDGDWYLDRIALAEHWCNQITKGLAGLFSERLRCIGRASNGEAFFEKVNR